MASVAGWRAVFWLSALLMLAIAAWLAKALPAARAAQGAGYGQILGSMIHILRDEPALQRRAVYQGLAFAVFNIFWTAAPLVLARTFAFDEKADRPLRPGRRGRRPGRAPGRTAGRPRACEAGHRRRPC